MPKSTQIKKASVKKNSQQQSTTGFPADISPMLATLVTKPPDEPGWVYEIKWDGYRAISYLNAGNAEIRSRNNKSFDEKFYPIHQALKNWKINAVVDGEIIVQTEKGVPHFEDLQGWRSEADGQLAYYVFDILWLEGKNLMDFPLSERREILKSLVPAEGIIRLSKNHEATGNEFYELAAKMDLEGIIAKKSDSKYIPDTRSKEWLKIKTEKRQEAVIGGYTVNENTTKKFSALLLGVFDGDEFNFIGPVGTGFSVETQKELLAKMKKFETKNCPFPIEPEYNKPSRFRPNPPKATVTWLKPALVAEISYREITRDGILRHPSFKGLREDKSAKEVTREEAIDTSMLIKDDNKLIQEKVITSPGKKERITFLNPKDESQVRNINGHDLKFSNLSKVFWPKENLTKRDMLNYYYQVAPYMLPYMNDRPQTLNRHPHGIEGESFYQKDVKGKVPSWIDTFPYYSHADEREKNFLVCTDEASLLYIASLGCIEMNPWHSRKSSPDHPDWCIIDLDPDKNTFEQVIDAACVTKKVLDAIDVPAYCKTSGSTGLHIYIPFGAKYTYEDSKEFGRALVKIVHSEIPDYTSIERKTADRGGKMYLDFLQNRPQATVAAVYSLRPKPGAPVSMPLHWEEVKKGLTIGQFNLRNAVSRLKEQGDIFKGVLDKGINLESALNKLKQAFK